MLPQALHAEDQQADEQESQGQAADEPAAPASGASAAELAKKLSNPLAAMISVPFQLNYDKDYGTEDTGHLYKMNIQPVIPFSMNEKWNIISRSILPVMAQADMTATSGKQGGLGDLTQSLWLSPKAPTSGGMVWGVGGVALIPTATDDMLGGGKWGLGPTAVALIQNGPWTYGGLANHVWSVVGNKKRNSISSTFLQPFLAYNTPQAVSISLNSESTYNWKTEEWSIPINLMVSKVVALGKQRVSIQGGIRYWLKTPDSGPEGLGLRFAMTFIFPK